MTAYFYCWDTTRDICPRRPDFKQRLREAQACQASPSTKLLEFVASLLAEYPGLAIIEFTQDGAREGDRRKQLIRHQCDRTMTGYGDHARAAGMKAISPELLRPSRWV
ncbi:MAG: hypothetical protein IT537_19695 [Hyphomicrobiales bacterium]|nr:hypothetical protein [Hyphomicrobiales bacterium]